MAGNLFLRPVDDRHDKTVFMFFLGLGLFGIIGVRFGIAALTNQEGLGWTDWIALLIAIGSIILYVVYILKTPSRSSVSLDRAGDNIYYLGLLFTLCSLGVSLIKLVWLPESGQISSSHMIGILPDFGLALFATIVGIAGRVIVQQLRNDPADIEADARQALGEAIRELRLSLTGGVSEMHDLINTITRSSKDMTNEINKSMKSAVESIKEGVERNTELLDQIGKNVEQDGEIIKQTSSTVTSSITEVGEGSTQALKDSARDITETLKQSATTHANQIESTSERLKEISDRTDSLVRNMGQFQQEMINEMRESISVMRSQFGELTVDQRSFEDQVNSVSAEITRLKTSVIEFSTSQQQMNKALDEASEKVAMSFQGDLRGPLDRATGDAAEVISNVASETHNELVLTRSTAVTEIDSATSNTVDQLNTLGSQTSQAREQIEEVTTEVAQTASGLQSDLQTPRDSVNESSEESAQATTEYVDSLTDAAKTLRRLTDEVE